LGTPELQYKSNISQARSALTSGKAGTVLAPVARSGYATINPGSSAENAPIHALQYSSEDLDSTLSSIANAARKS
jgi:hypothetical protein